MSNKKKDNELLNKKISMHEGICNGLIDLYARKNTDYGDAFSKSIEDFGYIAPVIRMEDKFNRIKTLIKTTYGPNVKDESIEDTLLDLANYAIMTVIEMRLDNNE